MASNEDDKLTIQNLFFLHDGPRCHVTLSRDGLCYRKLSFSKIEPERICLRDIVGCQCMRDRPKRLPAHRSNFNTTTNSDETNGPKTNSQDVDQTSDIINVYICFYCYPLKRKRMGKKLVRTRISIIFLIDCHTKSRENLALAERWKNLAHFLIRHPTSHVSMFNPTSRKLLIFVNPRSGPGKALQIFQQRVIPILAEAGIEHSLIITDKSNHAREYVATCKDLNYWDGIVIVSGDGLLFEVFNGLMERTDWKSAIKTPVGVVPGGSGNGLARAIGHALEEPYLQHAVLSSSLNLVSGRTKPMDLIRVQTQNTCCYSFLSVGWGLLADIDIESEKLRAIGEPRFALWSLAKIIGLRSYSGRVSYIEADIDTNLTKPATPLHNILTRSATFTGEQSEYDRVLVQRATSFPGDLRHSINDENDGAAFSPQPSEIESTESVSFSYSSSLPPLHDPVPSTWTSIEDSFLLVYVVYQTHIGSDVFCAPSARLDDGIMWLLTVRKGASRTQLLSFMMSLESGEHTRCPFADMIPIRAVRIEPFTGNGHMTVDGESVEYGPLQAEVLPSIARVMVR